MSGRIARVSPFWGSLTLATGAYLIFLLRQFYMSTTTKNSNFTHAIIPSAYEYDDSIIVLTKLYNAMGIL